MTAKKFDSDKPDLSLNPRVALEQMAYAFQLGEKKYGRYNFHKGMEASRLVAATLRHVCAWNEGENADPESGKSHLGHALACIAMILEQERRGTLKDNRPVQVVDNKAEDGFTKLTDTIVDKYASMGGPMILKNGTNE